MTTNVTKTVHVIKMVVFWLLISSVLIIALFPCIWILLTSLKRPILVTARPPVWFFRPTFENYNAILFGGMLGEQVKVGIAGGEITRYFVNSLIIVPTSTLLCLFMATLVAFSTTRLKFRGEIFIIIVILFSRILPPIASIIPLYLILNSLRLLDSHIGLISVYTAYRLPLVILLLRAFFQEIPAELEEAAMVDGCTKFGGFLRITFPLAAPGVVASAILAFIFSWNDLEFALFLTRVKTVTLPVAALNSMTESGVRWGTLSATGMVIIIPIIVFTFMVQKHLVRGLTMGAIKG